MPQWHDAAQKASMLPVSAADAHLLLERLTTGKGHDQSSLNSIQIVGMNYNFPDFLRILHLRHPV
jgi:hypothetical protein